MPLTFLLRFVFSLLSLVILGIGIGLTWGWYRENAYFTSDGEFMVLLADWPLWLGLALLLLSFGGKWLWLLLLARPNSKPKLRHGEGSKITTISGAPIFVHEEGAKGSRPIIFVHGSSLDSSVWTYARKEFSDHQVIEFDLVGLGRSGKSGPVTMVGMAEDLLSIIDKQTVAPILVGHSMGGMIIQTLAKHRPDLFDGSRIAGVVLVNTSYTNPLKTMILSGLLTALQPVIELMCRLQIWLQPVVWLGAWQGYLSGSAHIANRITFGKTPTRDELEHVTLISTRNPPGVIAEGILAMLHWDATDALQFSQTPVLVIGGHNDIVTKPEASEYIAASCPTSKLVLVEGANHMSFLDMSEHYHALIRADMAA
jgi:pimeloyl-ACP methyl ester carboxylesterase